MRWSYAVNRLFLLSLRRFSLRLFLWLLRLL
nr:MAG TPA: hypothetical protein [Caudoviricetes sp.]